MKPNKYMFHVAGLFVLILLPTGLAYAADANSGEYQEISGKEFDHRHNSGWSITLSGGVILAPRFLGDDDYETSAIPNVTATYDDLFFASLNGVGFNLINQSGLKAGPIAKYNFGRNESDASPLSISGDPNTDLVGLGDIDGSFEVGGFISYTYENIQAKIEARQGLGDGHEGMIAEASVTYEDQFNIGKLPVFWALGPKIIYGDETYNSAFFDVNASQSAASGLAQYDAGAGLISYGLQGRIVVPVSERSAVVAFGGVDFLGDELADSSLVLQRGTDVQSLFGFMMTYKLK
ncbi:MAG: MipA/OmpV family protein [Pseudomonadota bacterium]